MSGKADLLKQYAAGIEALIEATFGLSPTDLDTSLTPQSWTIRQIVHHVVDGDDLWKTCIKAAFGSKEPFNMAWYWDVSQDNWVEVWHYAER
ncbi:MAG: glyoxalase, partial [Chloroflexota bacterium]